MVNLVYVDVKQSISQLYSKNPKIFFSPLTPEAEDASEIFELLVNQKWEERKMKPLMRDAIKSTRFFGMCAFKTYYQFKKDFVKSEWRDRVENDDVLTDIVPLDCLLKDPDSPTWFESGWIAHKINARIDHIAKRFNLRKDKKEQIKVVKQTTGSVDLPKDQQRAFQYGTYYEIEHREEGKFYYLVEGLDDFAEVKNLEIPYDTMYDFLMYNDVPGIDHPLPHYSPWESQLKEIALYRTMRLSHARKGQGKLIVRGDDDPTMMEALKSPSVKAIVKASANTQIDTLPHPQMDSITNIAENIARSDIQLISKNAPRQSAGDDKTATEVKANELAAQEVSGEEVDRLDEVIESIAGKWAKLIKENYTTTRMVALSEMPKARFIKLQETFKDKLSGTRERGFLNVTPDMLSDKVRAKVQAGSTRPDTDQSRAQKMQAFVGAIGQLGLAAALDKEELVKELEKAFDVEGENLTVFKDNPMEESRLLNSGVFVVPKISDKHDEHIAILDSQSNGNPQNELHRAIHLEFKKMLEEVQTARLTASSGNLNAPLTGASFVGNDALVGSDALTNAGQSPAQPPVSGAKGVVQ